MPRAGRHNEHAAGNINETIAMNQFVTLARDTNQARGIAEYAIDTVTGRHRGPNDAVLKRVEQFHLDSVACGVSALVRRRERPHGVTPGSVGISNGSAAAGCARCSAAS